MLCSKHCEANFVIWELFNIIVDILKKITIYLMTIHLFLRQEQCVHSFSKSLTLVTDLISSSTKTSTLKEPTLVLSVLLDMSRSFVTLVVRGGGGERE